MLYKSALSAQVQYNSTIQVHLPYKMCRYLPERECYKSARSSTEQVHLALFKVTPSAKGSFLDGEVTASFHKLIPDRVVKGDLKRFTLNCTNSEA